MDREQNICRRQDNARGVSHRRGRGSVASRAIGLASRTISVRGFTLVELMVTIVIIAILAGIVLVAAQAAQNAANEANTRALIAKLHGQLMIRLESYRTRRLPITSTVQAINNPTNLPAPGTLTALQSAALRLNIIRELMRMELADRYSDLVVNNNPPAGINKWGLAFSPPSAPAFAIYDVNNSKWLPGPAQPATASVISMQRNVDSNGQSPSSQNEDAECLYLVLNTGLSDDTVAGELINPSNVGDTDGDGMKEFIDAWGRPIHFILWAPGVLTDVSALQNPDPSGHHDPFDPLKIQSAAYNLVPFIWSEGRDGVSDVQLPPKNTTTNFAQPSANFINFPCIVTFPPTLGWPTSTITIYNPYANSAVGGPADTDGDGTSDGYYDNITNHLIAP